MLERAIRNFARRGAFDQATRLFRELLDTDFGETRYSKLKLRFAAELAKEAILHEKRQIAEAVLSAAEAIVPAEHVDASDREIIARVRSNLGSL